MTTQRHCATCAFEFAPFGHNRCVSCDKTELSNWQPKQSQAPASASEPKTFIDGVDKVESTHELIGTDGQLGRKHDDGKLRYDLIPVHAERELVNVLTHGANVYGAGNWRLVDDAVARYTAALLRHIAAWRAGEAIDRLSGCHHLAHAATNAMFLFELTKDGSNHG